VRLSNDLLSNGLIKVSSSRTRFSSHRQTDLTLKAIISKTILFLLQEGGTHKSIQFVVVVVFVDRSDSQCRSDILSISKDGKMTRSMMQGKL
jgi:hypothetical protein